MNQNLSISKFTFVAFDFETTGLDSRNDRIIEIGAVKFKGSNILGEFESLINPGMIIPKKATEISGISNEMVSSASLIDSVLDDFLAFIEDAILLAHNASFDMSFLRSALERGGQPPPRNPIIDTQGLARRAYPKERSYSLQSLVALLGLHAKRSHRGLDDSIQCMKLFLSCIENLSFMGDISLKEILI